MTTNVVLKVSEAKNLDAKAMGPDPFVWLEVDGEKVARTTTKWGSKSPFWAEEFVLTLPAEFGRVRAARVPPPPRRF